MRSYIVQLALLLIALGCPSFAQKSAETVVRVAAGAPLAVECALRVEQRAEWRVDGGAPAPDLARSEAARGGVLRARLAAPAARPHHAGLYTCGQDSPRVRVLVLPATHVADADAGATTEGAVEPLVPDAVDTVYYDMFRLNGLQLNCTLADVDNAVTYVWSKNDTPVERVEQLKDRYELVEGGAVFRVKRTGEEDYGNYSCSVAGAVVRSWRALATPLAKLPHNLNVVEGQKLKVTCKLVGKPYPPVQWWYRSAEGENATAVEALLGERVTLRESAAGVPRGELVVAAAQRGDAGEYECRPERGVPDRATLRVKGMYDALWPFLGICAEVFVLCAIILVYEKRRTKPELDDSDTDNHEQKKS